jgi:hypothetical protein
MARPVSRTFVGVGFPHPGSPDILARDLPQIEHGLFDRGRAAIGIAHASRRRAPSAVGVVSRHAVERQDVVGTER